MTRNVVLFVAFVLLLFGTHDVFAQKATEIYIPYGKSPGLSGKYTLTGTIEAVDVQGQVITIKEADKSYTIRCDSDSKIWLDRSLLKQVNKVATLLEVQKGLMAEVKFRDNDRQKTVEWIKVQLSPEPESP